MWKETVVAWFQISSWWDWEVTEILHEDNLRPRINNRGVKWYEFSALRSDSFTPLEKISDTNWIGHEVGIKVHVGVVVKRETLPSSGI